MEKECNFGKYCVACTYPKSGMICRQVKRDKELELKRSRGTGPKRKYPKYTQVSMKLYINPHRYGGWLPNKIKRELFRDRYKGR
jgi:hypothetical protein